MSFLDERSEKLKKVLRLAYRHRSGRDVGAGWQAQTMRRIRQLPANGGAALEMMFESYAWRFAGAVCIPLIVLFVYAFHPGAKADSAHSGDPVAAFLMMDGE